MTAPAQHPPEQDFHVAVNGQPAKLRKPPNTPVGEIRAEAILQTANERWGGEDRWEVRTPRGELVDDSTELSSLVPNERGICAFIQLKPGIGA